MSLQLARWHFAREEGWDHRNSYRNAILPNWWQEYLSAQSGTTEIFCATSETGWRLGYLVWIQWIPVMSILKRENSKSWYIRSSETTDQKWAPGLHSSIYRRESRFRQYMNWRQFSGSRISYSRTNVNILFWIFLYNEYSCCSSNSVASSLSRLSNNLICSSVIFFSFNRWFPRIYSFVSPVVLPAFWLDSLIKRIIITDH